MRSHICNYRKLPSHIRKYFTRQAIFAISQFFIGKTPEIALPEHEFPVLALVFFEIPKMTLRILYFFALTRISHHPPKTPFKITTYITLLPFLTSNIEH